MVVEKWQRPVPDTGAVRHELIKFTTGHGIVVVDEPGDHAAIDRFLRGVVASAVTVGVGKALESAAWNTPPWQILERLAEDTTGAQELLAALRRTYLRRGQAFKVFWREAPNRWELQVVSDPGATAPTVLDQAVVTFVRERMAELRNPVPAKLVEEMVVRIIAAVTQEMPVANNDDNEAREVWMLLRRTDPTCAEILAALSTYTDTPIKVVVEVFITE